MRLIDADVLKGYFLKDAGPHPTEVMWEYWAIETEIDSCPTVDAVGVVRCKECKNHEDEEPGMVYCPHVIGGWVNEMGFCADGERKEERE